MNPKVIGSYTFHGSKMIQIYIDMSENKPDIHVFPCHLFTSLTPGIFDGHDVYKSSSIFVLGTRELKSNATFASFGTIFKTIVVITIPEYA